MTNELILKAQSGDKESMQMLVEKFKPLIKGLASKLGTEDGISELTLDFLLIILDIPEGVTAENCEAQLLAYIKKSMHRQYWKRAKEASKIINLLYINTDSESEYYFECKTASFDNYDSLENSGFGSKLSCLEQQVISEIYAQGHKEAYIANVFKVSRQAINKAKFSAFKKIKDYIVEKDNEW